MTKPTELRELTDDVLELRFAEAKDELFNLRFGHAPASSTTTTARARARREIPGCTPCAASERRRGTSRRGRTRNGRRSPGTE